MSSDARLASLFVARYPGQAAHALDGLPVAGVAAFLASLPPEQCDAVFEALPPHSRAACVQAFPEDRRKEIIDRMALSAAAGMMRAASPEHRASLLSVLSESRRTRLERALRFAEETAGGLAELEVPSAAQDVTVGEALKRSSRRGPDLPYVYAIDRDQHLVGVVSRRELGKAKPEARVDEIMHRDVRYLRAYTPVTELAAHPAWRDVDALPVVDGAGALVGVLRHKALRRKLEGSDTTRERAVGPGGVVALGTAYCELLARVMLSLTAAPLETGVAAQPEGEL